MKRVLAQGDTAADGGQPRGDGRPASASWPAAPRSMPRPNLPLDTSAQLARGHLRTLERSWCGARPLIQAQSRDGYMNALDASATGNIVHDLRDDVRLRIPARTECSVRTGRDAPRRASTTRPTRPATATGRCVRGRGRDAGAGHRRERRPAARLQAQAQQLRPGRRHRAGRRAEPHPLRASGRAHGRAHERSRTSVFCSGANIFMLGVSSHAWKVNFCKFTNETRNGLEDSSRHDGLKFLAAVNGACAGGGYELALWPATRSCWSTTARARSACPRCRCSACCRAPAA